MQTFNIKKTFKLKSLACFTWSTRNIVVCTSLCAFINLHGPQKEEERLRASIRRESQQRRIRERAHQRGLNAPYLEDEDGYDDDNAISLSAIKNKYKQGSKRKCQPMCTCFELLMTECISKGRLIKNKYSPSL